MSITMLRTLGQNCNVFTAERRSQSNLHMINLLRDFKNAPFYILCLFHMINLRMYSLSFFIFVQNGP